MIRQNDSSVSEYIKKDLRLIYPGEVFSKKNSKRIVFDKRTFKPRIISNERAQDQEIEMVWVFNSQLNSADWQKVDYNVSQEGREFEVRVKIWQKDRRRRDLDNQLTAILDGLVAANVIPDDSFIFVKFLQIEQSGIDKQNPRAEILVSERIKVKKIEVVDGEE